MVGNGRDDDGARGVSSQYLQTYCGNDRYKQRKQGMGVGLGGSGIESCMYLADKEVCEELADNNRKVYSSNTDIQTLYR